MTVTHVRAGVVRADGTRVQPIVKSLAGTSATKTQLRRAARLTKVLGETEKPAPKKVVRQRKLNSARAARLQQQKRSA